MGELVGDAQLVILPPTLKQKILQNLWKLLVQSPISRFGIVFDEFYTSVGGIKHEL